MIKLVLKQKYVERFNGKFKFRSYNLLEHSYMVTYLFIKICKEENIEIDSNDIFLVMNHDLPEVITTDIPYDVKHLNKATESAWETIEYHAIMQNSTELVDFCGINLKRNLADNKYEIFKICDFLDLFIFCKEEINLGNNDEKIHEAFKTCSNYLFNIISKYKSVKEIIDNL